MYLSSTMFFDLSALMQLQVKYLIVGIGGGWCSSGSTIELTLL
ncbi:10401_t:CDS:2 [Dentiscutata erythropus]|uniref:10401_t:CDS:1 n=1 Tax=Dentiscutata erythropus TaxID=1348616 RepID=A0A9N8YWV6_9GLOM|nr:10401_t:CDS:2 [Dentiscutata erythropus]